MVKADKIYQNGKIYTVNENRDWAEAVAIAGGKIAYVGDNAGSEAFRGAETEVVDLAGKMMLPGFMDGHCHPIMAAYQRSGVYLDIDYDLETCLKEIRAYVEANPDHDAYFGQGYAEWLFDVKGPSKALLDEICSDKPVLMVGSGGHEGWANSKALEMAGVNKDTEDPIPGFQYFGRDAEGNPSGHLMESIPLITVLTSVPFFEEKAVKRMMKENSEGYAAMGVTSVADMGIYRYVEDEGLEMVEKAIEEGDFLQRFTSCGASVEADEEMEARIEKLVQLRETYNDDRFRVNFLKIVNDGTLESRSAAMCEPYNEDGSMVDTMIKGDRLIEIAKMAAEKGLDIQVHALGDASVKETLNMAKAIREAGYDMRITNSHTQCVKPEDRPLFAKYDVIANTTTVWHYGNDDMIPVIGKERADDTFTLKTIIGHGARLSLGSDFPVDEYGRQPLRGIEMGVTRQMFGRPEAQVLKPESEKLTIDDCIAGYTINIAYQVRMEDKLGSIEPGKYADLVILEQNLFDVPVHEIHKVKVCETLLEGKTTYKA